MAGQQLSHLDEHGAARMVDVADKGITHRRAVATARVRMRDETLAMIVGDRAPKGDVLAVARVAGIMAAKRTSELIPLCHPIAITLATVELAPIDDGIGIRATVETDGPTGVEMEALTAASVAALTLYDMCKAVDRGMTIDGVQLLLKEGGQSGRWVREDGPSLPKPGVITSVNVSERKTVRKKRVGHGRLISDRGFEGDAHAGDWHRQVSLLAQESIDKMVAKGLNVGPGDFAENLTTSGIDLLALPIGSLVRVGDTALLEISQIGKECHIRCAIYYQAGDCVMPREGLFAVVREAGEINEGDPIEVVALGDGTCSRPSNAAEGQIRVVVPTATE